MLNYLCNKLRCMIYQLSKITLSKKDYGLDTTKENNMLNTTKSYLHLIENEKQTCNPIIHIPYGNIRAWIKDFDPKINLKQCTTCTITITQVTTTPDCSSITITQL